MKPSFIMNGHLDNQVMEAAHLLIDDGEIIPDDILTDVVDGLYQNMAEMHDERMRLIGTAQDNDASLLRIKKYLRREFDDMTRKDVARIGKVAAEYEFREHDVLVKMQWSTRRSRKAQLKWRLVMPNQLIHYAMQLCHSNFQGAHQGITRTYEKARSMFYWDTMSTDIKSFVKNCVDCNTAAPPPNTHVMSQGNVVPDYPFHTLGMDFAVTLPPTPRGNTVLCVWVCWFTGFVICKALPDRKAHTVACAYEQAVFSRFGASVQIRHDRDPAFMSDVFKAFNDLLGQRQLPTLAYNPQANGATERMIQTLLRSVKKYSEVPGHTDWDISAERMALAINTSIDTTRHDTPFYLVHGWDCQNTLQASLPTLRNEESRSAWRWRMEMQRDYRYCLDMAKDVIAIAKQERAEERNNSVEKPDSLLEGDLVWLYIDKVKTGAKKKLCHLWHGPFRIIKKPTLSSSILELNTLLPSGKRRSKHRYRFHEHVHDARLRLARIHPQRPTESIDEIQALNIDFDTDIHLPDASFEVNLEEADLLNLPVVEIHDVRWVERANGRRVKEYKVTNSNRQLLWMPDYLIPPTSLVYDFDRERLDLIRFEDMRSEKKSANRKVIESQIDYEDLSLVRDQEALLSGQIVHISDTPDWVDNPLPHNDSNIADIIPDHDMNHGFDPNPEDYVAEPNRLDEDLDEELGNALETFDGQDDEDYSDIPHDKVNTWESEWISEPLPQDPRFRKLVKRRMQDNLLDIAGRDVVETVGVGDELFPNNWDQLITDAVDAEVFDHENILEVVEL